MSRRIGLIAALPSELKPLVRGWKRLSAVKPVHLWTMTDADGDVILAACAGMGAVAARRAFAAAESLGALDMVLSVGFAGATEAVQHAGEVSVVTEIIDVQTGERFQLNGGKHTRRLATVPQTADAPEKVRLLASYGAELVDMEAATVARLAAMRGVPMGCFKAVSDTADAALPVIDPFVDREGQLSLPRFLAHLSVRPRSWPAVARLARSSELAAKVLGEVLRRFLKRKDLGDLDYLA